MGKDDKGKVKMTVIHFETESDNATLQENIRSIAQTITRALSAPRVVQTNAQASLTNGVINDGSDHDEEEQVDFEDDGNTTVSVTKKKGGARQYASPEIIELELSSGEKPLKEFLDEKNPENDVKKYLAISYWLKSYLNINEVGMNHAYTCYRHMGWQVPKDAAAPFRAMKQKRYGWMKSTTRGLFSINHVGENQIQKMGNE